MNKKELKKAFEKEFEKIFVSDELKSKTLKAIKDTPAIKTSHIHYIRNFAAIFVVTLLCISIYFANNIPKNNSIKSNTLQDVNTSISENTKNDYNRDNAIMQKSEPTQNAVDSQTTGNANIETFTTPEISSKYSASYDAAPNFALQATNAPNDIGLQDSSFLKEKDEKQQIISITEEDFLNQYPEAEKVESGYIIYEDGKEKIYVFKDKKLENIIIID